MICVRRKAVVAPFSFARWTTNDQDLSRAQILAPIYQAGLAVADKPTMPGFTVSVGRKT